MHASTGKTTKRLKPQPCEATRSTGQELGSVNAPLLHHPCRAPRPDDPARLHPSASAAGSTARPRCSSATAPTPNMAGASACSIEAPTHGGRPKRRFCTRRRLLRCRIGLLGLLVIAGQVKRCFRLVIARRLKPRFRQAEPLALLVRAWGHICHPLAAFRVGPIPLRSAHRIKLNC